MKKEVLEKMYSGVVELSEQKVELALIDDIQSLYEKANKLYKSNTDALNNFASKMEKDFQLTADTYKSALDKYNQLEKSAKDLGVDLTSSITKYKDLIEFGLKDSLQSKSNAVNIMAI